MSRLKSVEKEVRGEAYYKRHYGPQAVITRLGKITLVHLDKPSPRTIKKRLEEITREEISGEAWDECCPLCQMFKDKPHDVLYPAKGGS